MADLLLGVDVGTRVTKAVLCTPEGDSLGSAHVSHAVEIPRVGWCEQDAEHVWWADLCAVTRRVIAEAGVRPIDVAAVGCSGMTPNMVALDRGGCPLRTAILYCDTRASEIYPDILERVSEEEVLSLTGFRLSAHGGWQGAQLLWMREKQPALYSRVSKVVGTTSYLCYRLTGEFAADHAVARCNVPFYDQHERAWSSDICELFDIPPTLFPDRIGYAAELAGQVTVAAARECGLLEGTPVIIGTMDTNADMIAAGVTQPGDVGLVYGTSLIASRCAEEPVCGRTGFANDYVIPGRFLCGSGVQTAGALTHWFLDAFGADQVDQGTHAAPAFGSLDQGAASVPAGADGLLVVPMFAGDRRILGGRLATGALLGLTTFHNGSHIYRAVLEGTAFELRRQFATIAPSVRLRRIRSVGGGTQSRLWTQIVTDILDATQRCYPETFGAPLGDAYLSGLGIGLLSGFDSLRRTWLRAGYEVSPRPARRDAYDRAYQTYLDALRLLGIGGSV